MTTPLGGAAGGGLTLAVINNDTTRIEKGRIVSFAPAGTLTELGTNSQITHMTPITSCDGTRYAGVTVAAIESGGTGIIITQGPAYIETDGTVVDSDYVEIADIGADPDAGTVKTATTTTVVIAATVGYALADDFSEATSDFIADGATAATYALSGFDSAANLAAGLPLVWDIT